MYTKMNGSWEILLCSHEFRNIHIIFAVKVTKTGMTVAEAMIQTLHFILSVTSCTYRIIQCSSVFIRIIFVRLL